MARAYAGRLNELQQTYADQGLQIVGVFSNVQDSLEDVQKYEQEQQLAFSAVVDPGNAIADRFGATRTPEVFLLDRDLKLRYHGRIDDQYAPGVARSAAVRQDLRDAIDSLLAGKPIRIPETVALGCIIGRAARGGTLAALPADEAGDAPPGLTIVEGADVASQAMTSSSITYHKDVVGMIQRNCLECHRTGEIGPFAMDSYQEIVGWAETMLETMDNGRMPPWHAAPEYGEFTNARHLSPADHELFRQWIAAGLPEGRVEDAPTAVEYVEGWQLPRAPDLVIPMRNRPYVVPKSGVVEYQYFVAELGIDEDRWISAAEVKPGNAAVVHHAIAFIRPPDGARFRGLGWMGAYVPGQRAQILPPGHARFLPAGSKLVFQMHYTPNGIEQSDVTSIGINFVAEDEVTDEVFTLVGIDQQFEIPPAAGAHTVQAEVPRLPAGGKLLAVTPHMHFRGKSFKLFAGLERDRVMLHVPNYDFNWQHTYVLSEPERLDSIERLSFDVVFDNSSANPFNPDPNAWVTWGDQTWEEMAVAFFEVSAPHTENNSVRMASRDNNSEVQKPDQSSTGSEASVSEVASQRQAKVDAYVAKLLKELDLNQDGKIRRSETGIVLRRWNFELWDTNLDDVITPDELRAVAERMFR